MKTIKDEILEILSKCGGMGISRRELTSRKFYRKYNFNQQFFDKLLNEMNDEKLIVIAKIRYPQESKTKLKMYIYPMSSNDYIWRLNDETRIFKEIK